MFGTFVNVSNTGIFGIKKRTTYGRGRAQKTNDLFANDIE